MTEPRRRLERHSSISSTKGTGMEHQAAQTARSARWAPALAVVAVVAIVAAATALLSGGARDGAGAPPVLRLSSAAAESSGSSGSSADSFFVASSTMLAGSYRLEGELPTDGPEQGRVHRLTGGQVDEDVVRRLATALGISADPQHADGRWTAVAPDGGATLDVADDPGNPWWYGPAQQQVNPVGDDPVDGATALAAVRPALEALGLADADVRTDAYGGVRAVIAARLVDGLPAQGMETRFEVDHEGRLLWASGMLGGTSTGEQYPLVSAQGAFDRLVSRPHHDIAALCAPDQPCGPVEQVITGARPGLQLHHDEEGPLLVPAWLFTVRDAPEPVGQVAVEAEFLQAPVMPEPVTPEPPPVAEPGAPVERTTFGFDRVARGVQPHELVVGYGDSGSCPHRNVTPLVQETDDTVTVRLEADAIPPDTPCTDDYIGIDLVVPLERPLGDRLVVDDVTGEQHALGS